VATMLLGPVLSRTHTNADTKCVGYTEMLISGVSNTHGSVSNKSKWAVMGQVAQLAVSSVAPMLLGPVLSSTPLSTLRPQTV